MERRFCLKCCIVLSQHWSANSDVLLWLWDHFHKRMVRTRTRTRSRTHDFHKRIVRTQTHCWLVGIVCCTFMRFEKVKEETNKRTSRHMNKQTNKQTNEQTNTRCIDILWHSSREEHTTMYDETLWVNKGCTVLFERWQTRQRRMVKQALANLTSGRSLLLCRMSPSTFLGIR